MSNAVERCGENTKIQNRKKKFGGFWGWKMETHLLNKLGHKHWTHMMAFGYDVVVFSVYL